jgi:hypothetical protein
MRNPCKDCIYYHKENKTCQSKKCATGGNGKVSWIDRLLCSPCKKGPGIFCQEAAWEAYTEQDYMQEQLDGALREIFGEATVPFAVRHPYIRGIDYTKKRR